jgi:hypothetical protein
MRWVFGPAKFDKSLGKIPSQLARQSHTPYASTLSVHR